MGVLFAAATFNWPAWMATLCPTTSWPGLRMDVTGSWNSGSMISACSRAQVSHRRASSICRQGFTWSSSSAPHSDPVV
jgi:hypothetical protein